MSVLTIHLRSFDARAPFTRVAKSQFHQIPIMYNNRNNSSKDTQKITLQNDASFFDTRKQSFKSACQKSDTQKLTIDSACQKNDTRK